MRCKRHFKNLNQAKIVPVGENCMVAHHLRRFNLLAHHYGLEWIVTPSLSTLTTWLIQAAPPFFQPQNIQCKDESSIVKDVFYNLTSVHDYKNGGQCEAENMEVHKMFSRRLARLKNVLEHSTHIVFIRFQQRAVTKNEDILILLNTLRAYYPDLKVYFYLVYDQHLKPEIFLKEIVYIPYKITIRHRVKNRLKRLISPKRYQLQLWQGDRGAWRKIFKIIDRQYGHHVDVKNNKELTHGTLH